MRKKIINIFIIIALTQVCLSCNLIDSKTPDTQITYKNVRYVVNMISSSIFANPKIKFTNQNEDTSQVQVMNLDIIQQIKVGLTANLEASCEGAYGPPFFKSSAAVDLKIYVNDTLQAEANDFKTDSLTIVTASTKCSYGIK